MKKFALLPLAALLLLGACSDDEPQIVIPDKPVQTQNPVADKVKISVPKQKSNTYSMDGSLYVFEYENGQKIAYTMTTSGEQRIAVVKKILGTASDVTIPYAVTGKVSDTATAEWTVVSIDLYHDAVAETVRTVKIPQTVCYTYNSASQAYLSNDDSNILQMVSLMPSVQKIELEEGYPGYCSVNGAIYSDDMLRLVAVPRAFKGEFTIADGVAAVGPHAFFHCGEIDILTVPASVEAFGEEAVTFCGKLLVVNILAAEAPVAYIDTFGDYVTTNGVLRIKKGTKASYLIAKPTMEKPVEPVPPEDPDMDADDSVWEAYDKAYAEYTEKMIAFNEANDKYNALWDAYNEKEGYAAFKTIQERF